MKLGIGDIVARKSYDKDIFFKIENIFVDNAEEVKATLRGLDVRLYADAPLDDLIRVENGSIRQYRRNFIEISNQCLTKVMKNKINRIPLDPQNVEPSRNFFEVPGRVLHLDGSQEYLDLCIAIYKQMEIKAKGFQIPEKDQPASVPGLLETYKPDILVLTGHDGLIKSKESFSDINNYHSSTYFVEGVKAARRLENNKDDLIIFAGACQSHYEAILSAGANFASSPFRVLIHALDPVFIVEKIAFTSIDQKISINDVVDNTITGTDGLGGIETRGKYRKGFPKSPY